MVTFKDIRDRVIVESHIRTNAPYIELCRHNGSSNKWNVIFILQIDQLELGSDGLWLVHTNVMQEYAHIQNPCLLIYHQILTQPAWEKNLKCMLNCPLCF